MPCDLKYSSLNPLPGSTFWNGDRCAALPIDDGDPADDFYLNKTTNLEENYLQMPDEPISSTENGVSTTYLLEIAEKCMTGEQFLVFRELNVVGLSQKVIARSLGVSVSSVSQTYRRGLKNLRENLKEENVYGNWQKLSL